MHLCDGGSGSHAQSALAFFREALEDVPATDSARCPYQFDPLGRTRSWPKSREPGYVASFRPLARVQHLTIRQVLLAQDSCRHGHKAGGFSSLLHLRRRPRDATGSIIKIRTHISVHSE